MQKKKTIMYRWNETFNHFETHMEYLNMKSSNKQKHIFIYIYHPKTFLLVELQKMCITRKEKIYAYVHRHVVQSQRTNNITRAWLPKTILEISLSIPTLHILEVSDQSSFPLDYFLIPFWFCSTKNAGLWTGIVEITWWPQATTYPANFSWLAQWTALVQVNLCTRATSHLAVFSHQTMIKASTVFTSGHVQKP